MSWLFARASAFAPETVERAVQSLFADSPIKEIHGVVPVAEMFSYSTTLRSLTQGRGTFHTGHVRYSQVPKSIADEVVRRTLAKRRGDGQAA